MTRWLWLLLAPIGDDWRALGDGDHAEDEAWALQVALITASHF